MVTAEEKALAPNKSAKRKRIAFYGTVPHYESTNQPGLKSEHDYCSFLHFVHSFVLLCYSIFYLHVQAVHAGMFSIDSWPQAISWSVCLLQAPSEMLPPKSITASVSWCQLALINRAIITRRCYLSWWSLPRRPDSSGSDNRLQENKVQIYGPGRAGAFIQGPRRFQNMEML